MDTGHASCQFNSAWMHDDNDDDDKTGEREAVGTRMKKPKKEIQENAEREMVVAQRERQFTNPPRNDVTFIYARVSISPGAMCLSPLIIIYFCARVSIRA